MSTYSAWAIEPWGIATDASWCTAIIYVEAIRRTYLMVEETTL
jgi:hypothetical protein